MGTGLFRSTPKQGPGRLRRKSVEESVFRSLECLVNSPLEVSTSGSLDTTESKAGYPEARRSGVV